MEAPYKPNNRKWTSKQAWRHIAKKAYFTTGLCREVNLLCFDERITRKTRDIMKNQVQEYGQESCIPGGYFWGWLAEAGSSVATQNRIKLAKAFAAGKTPPAYKGFYEAI